MSLIYYNPNPDKLRTSDCTVRAICAATGAEWEKAYTALCVEGLALSRMPDAQETWWSYLRGQGFDRRSLPNTCPDCYTIDDFCKDNPDGVFILATKNHVVTVKDGDIWDTWDSGGEIPFYFWQKVGS